MPLLALLFIFFFRRPSSNFRVDLAVSRNFARPDTLSNKLPESWGRQAHCDKASSQAILSWFEGHIAQIMHWTVDPSPVADLQEFPPPFPGTRRTIRIRTYLVTIQCPVVKPYL